MKKSSKKVEIGWGDGASDLFLAVEEGGISLLNYENDTTEVHRLGGGRNYYVSCSGLSGAGYITNLSTLIPIGGYRVETRFDGWTYGPAVVTGGRDEIEILVPTENHISEERQEALLREKPLIVRRKKSHDETELFLLRWGRKRPSLS